MTINRYYVTKSTPGLGAVREVPEAALDDTTPAAVVACADYNRDRATEAELDQFFHKDGFFRLSCSNELPPDVLARALLAAWRAVERDVTRAIEGDHVG